jgi:hypothetical protein
MFNCKGQFQFASLKLEVIIDTWHRIKLKLQQSMGLLALHIIRVFILDLALFGPHQSPAWLNKEIHIIS